MKLNRKTITIGLIVALAAVGLWTFSTVWFINVFAVAIIVLGLSLLVLGLRRLWRWKKAVVVGLSGVFAVLSPWVFFYEGTESKTLAAPTKPQSRLEVVPAAEFGVTQKYPPYPEVWGYGYELTFPVPEDRRVSGVWKMDNGDYFFIYTKSEQIARKDGTCCDFRYENESLQFFSGVRKDTTRREIEQLRNKYQSLSGNSYQKITFSDGSSIERGQADDSAHCYFPYHIVKKDRSGKVIVRKSLLYLRDWHKAQSLNPDCEDSGGMGNFNQFVGEIGYSFLPLSDDTFVVYGGGGNFIRFDKDFNTRYRLNDQVFLIDAHIVEELIKQSADTRWKETKLKGNVSNASIIDSLVGNHLRKQRKSEIDVPAQGADTTKTILLNYFFPVAFVVTIAVPSLLLFVLGGRLWRWKKTAVLWLLGILAVLGLWNEMMLVNILVVAVAILSLILFVRGLYRLWRWKKTAVLGLLGILAVLGLWAFFHQGAEPKTFMDEVRAARAKNKTTQVPIHDLVAKYIPKGTRKETALEFCAGNGFKIYPIRDKRAFSGTDPKTYDEAISCTVGMTRWDLLWWFWIGGDTISLTMGIKDGVVVWAGGAISFTSL